MAKPNRKSCIIGSAMMRRKRHRVAPHLDPFLAQHGEEAPEGEAAHCLLRPRQQMDEHVLEPRLDLAPVQTLAACVGDRLLERARSVPATWSERPNTAAASTPGVWRSRRAASSISSPVASKVTSPAWRATSSGAPCDDDAAVGEIDDALAALGLVHVVRRDQHGEAFARPCRGSGPRTRAAPWRRRRRSARRAAAASAGAARRRRAPGAASSRPRAARRAGRARGPSAMRAMIASTARRRFVIS